MSNDRDQGVREEDVPKTEKKQLVPTLRRLIDNLSARFEIDGTLKDGSRAFYGPVLLCGDWGSGKSSVLKCLANELGTLPSSSTPRGVIFEAWHYERTGDLLPMLIRTIGEASGVFEENQEENKKQNDRKKKFKEIFSLSLSIGTHVGGVLSKALGIPILPDLLKTIYPILSDADKTKKKAPEADSKGLNGLPKDPVRELRKELNTFIKEVWGEVQPVILIDDLDRCNPDSMVSLLEAIRFLVADTLGGPGNPEPLRCKFVVAIDHGIVTQAITNKFLGIEGFDGNRYLEKIFPYSFYLPTVYDQDATFLLKEMLKNYRDRDWSLNLIDAVAQVLKRPFFANPRLILRTSLRYFLVLEYLSDGQSIKDIQPIGEEDVLASWIAATQRWPRLRHIMQQRDDRYWKDIHESVESSNESRMPGPEAVNLLSQTGARTWLREELFLDDSVRRQAFRRADEKLRKCCL